MLLYWRGGKRGHFCFRKAQSKVVPAIPITVNVHFTPPGGWSGWRGWCPPCWGGFCPCWLASSPWPTGQWGCWCPQSGLTTNTTAQLMGKLDHPRQGLRHTFHVYLCSSVCVVFSWPPPPWPPLHHPPSLLIFIGFPQPTLIASGIYWNSLGEAVLGIFILSFPFPSARVFNHPDPYDDWQAPMLYLSYLVP